MFMTKVTLTTAFGALIVCTALSSATYSIPADRLDANKVYFGVSASFEKPGEVNYERVVKATPEYKQVKTAKLESGTGKYWILMSQASDRAVKAISTVGKQSEFDLIVAQGYLSSMEPAIPAEDITKLVIKEVDESSKDVKKQNSSSKYKAASK